MGPTEGLKVLDMRKVSCSCRDSNPGQDVNKGTTRDMFRIDKDTTVKLIQALNFRSNILQMFGSDLGWGYRLY